MNNYIILNGINSNTITGLIIQSLPPISKPLMRTNIETIDGKDGDIITKLGYSAYDKEISIGLSYNYNVDDVIEFFNSEGTVIFSNEPTKYYKYTILDQIDFNRLIRFKTATVRMHVQPFKYSTTEEDIEENATETDNEGTNFTLENTENGAGLLDVKLKGNTSQDGTPTPSTPVDIDVVTGDNTVTLCGKNLANITSKYNNNYSATLENNIITINGTSASAGGVTAYLNNQTDLILKANKTYTISVICEGIVTGSTHKVVYARIGNTSVNIGSLASNKTITYTYTPSEDTLLKLINFDIGANNTFTNFVAKYQVEQNASATPYASYQSQSFTLSLGDIELCKIGNYQDIIYKENDKWYVEKNIGKVVLNGTESWGEASSFVSNTKRYYVDNSEVINSENVEDNNVYTLSNNFVGISWKDIYGSDTTTTNAIANYNSSSGQGRIVIRMSMSVASSLSDFKSWLTNNNTPVYYVLETSTTTEITETNLISQLEALNGATTYEGQTNIITAGDLQPIIYVKTFAMDNPSYTVTNSGNYFAKPVMTIYGIGTVGVYLDGVQVLSLNLNENQTDHITIDVPNMNAYTDTINTLRNRAVTGDYNNLKFNVGDNELSFSGTIQGFIIQNYSRWL